MIAERCQKKNICIYICILFLLGAIYRIICSMQGVDCIDAGFNSTYFLHLFSHPDAVIYNYLYYVTGLLGAACNSIFQDGGLYALRMVELALVVCGVGLLCKAFFNHLSTNAMLLAIVFSFLLPVTMTTLHYNTITYIMVIVAAIIYASEYKEDRWWKLMLCGYAIGVIFLARIVNLSLLTLCFIPLLTDIHKHSITSNLIKSITVFTGMMLGLGTILGIMHILGHTDYFLQALQMAFGTLGDSSSSHSSGGILLAYIKGAVNVILQMTVMATGYIIWQKGESYDTNKKKWLRVIAVIVIIAVVLTNPPHLSFTAICILLTASHLWKTRNHWNEVCLLSFFLVTSALLMPLGSDIGIAGICHWTPGLLIFPAAFAVTKIECNSTRRFYYIIFATIAIFTITRNICKPYCGDGTRFNQTTMIGGRLNILDSAESAKKYRHVLETIENKSNGNQYLVLPNHQTQLYYATGMIPFLGVTESHYYEGKYLQQRLEERAQYYNTLPAIAIINSIGIEKPDTQAETIKFAKRHNYRKVYSDKDITIYLPI